MILVTPDGEKMLVNGGNPSRDDRDTKRIVAAAHALGIKQFDYMLATHYDSDHVGNLPHIDSLIPTKAFIDHGDPIPTLNARSRHSYYGRYPLHDTTDQRAQSFSVNVAIRGYRCHKCDHQGNQLELWATFTRRPLYPASIALCRALGREVPWLHRR